MRYIIRTLDSVFATEQGAYRDLPALLASRHFLRHCYPNEPVQIEEYPDGPITKETLARIVYYSLQNKKLVEIDVEQQKALVVTAKEIYSTNLRIDAKQALQAYGPLGLTKENLPKIGEVLVLSPSRLQSAIDGIRPIRIRRIPGTKLYACAIHR